MIGKKALWVSGAIAIYWAALTIASWGWSFQDFFQDWASARNWWEGIGVYAPHSLTVPRYLHTEFDRLAEGKQYAIVATVKINAHPPSSVLFYLPFALLPYQPSFFLWNLLSVVCLAWALWMLARELKFRASPWHLVWLAPLAVFGGPLFENMIFGQSSTVILALVVMAWYAQRRGWPITEGCCLGAAAAFKLFPLALLIIPLGTRRWRSLSAGIGTVVFAVGLSVLLFGNQIWSEYTKCGLSEAVIWGDLWPNASLSGFWRKLFVSQNKAMAVGDWFSPTGFWVGYSATCALVGLVSLGLVAWRGRNRDLDGSYAVGIGAMLLLSPTCWPNYFLILLLPAALLWQQAPALRGMLVACLVPLVVPSGLALACCGLFLDGADRAAGPLATLTVLALQTYALMGMWLISAAHEFRTLRGTAAVVPEAMMEVGAQRRAA